MWLDLSPIREKQPLAMLKASGCSFNPKPMNYCAGKYTLWNRNRNCCISAIPWLWALSWAIPASFEGQRLCLLISFGKSTSKPCLGLRTVHQWFKTLVCNAMRSIEYKKDKLEARVLIEKQNLTGMAGACWDNSQDVGIILKMVYYYYSILCTNSTRCVLLLTVLTWQGRRSSSGTYSKIW